MFIVHTKILHINIYSIYVVGSQPSLNRNNCRHPNIKNLSVCTQL